MIFCVVFDKYKLTNSNDYLRVISPILTLYISSNEDSWPAWSHWDKNSCYIDIFLFNFVEHWYIMQLALSYFKKLYDSREWMRMSCPVLLLAALFSILPRANTLMPYFVNMTKSWLLLKKMPVALSSHKRKLSCLNIILFRRPRSIIITL